MAKNMIIKSLGYYKRKIKILNSFIYGFIQKGICTYCEEFLDLFNGERFKIYFPVSLKVYSSKIPSFGSRRKAPFFCFTKVAI